MKKLLHVVFNEKLPKLSAESKWGGTTAHFEGLKFAPREFNPLNKLNLPALGRLCREMAFFPCYIIFDCTGS